MKKQSLAIISIITTGSLFGMAFAVTNGTIITGDLTVTGTCTGCGASDGTFTNWTTFTNSSTAVTSALSSPAYCQVDNHGNTMYADTAQVIIMMDNAGIKIKEFNINTPSGLTKAFDQTITGKYQVFQTSSSQFQVYQNTSLVKTIGFTASDYTGGFGGESLCISPDGKYIALLGKASANHERVVVFQGS